MKTILIVDDFRISNEVVAGDLRSMNYHVLEAQSGQQALKFFDGRQIDLVICDYKMPQQSGIELARSIRQLENYPHIPIIILSAKEPPDENILQNERITAWIKKPLNKAKLNSIIDKAF